MTAPSDEAADKLLDKNSNSMAENNVSRFISYSIFQNAIGRKLLLKLLSIVLLMTLTTVTYRLYQDYQNELTKLEQKIEHVKKAHEESIVFHLWNSDEAELIDELESILEFNRFDLVQVTGGKFEPVLVGEEPNSDVIDKTYKLRNRESGRSVDLRIVVSLEETRVFLKREMLTRLSFWAIVLIILSMAVMMTIHTVVTRHIKTMSDFTDQVEYLNPTVPMRLNRGASKNMDELDKLVDSYNRLQRRISSFHLELKGKNEALEEITQQKDQFLEDVSNELINSLNGLVDISESLIASNIGDLFPEEKEKLLMLASNSKRLSLLVNDIADFSKLKHGNVQLDCAPLHLKPLLKLILFLNKPLAEGKKLLIRTELGEQLPPLMADEIRMQQILQNVIKNAIQNTGKGQVIISTHLEGQQIKIEVKDTGAGISEEQLENLKRICNQDENLNPPNYSDLELGFCIAQKLTELHGGTFWIDSKLGYGTVIRLMFPVADPKYIGEAVLSSETEILRKIDDLSRETVLEGLPERKVIHPRHKILVVDDDKVAHFILESFLKEENYTVKIASDGKEALSMVEEQKPDLILLDIVMPGMNGFEVCAKLREKYSDSDLPIILLSSNSELQQQINGLSSGANDYLSKPVVKSELIARIQNQIKIMQANRRMSSLLDFAHQVNECKDARTLFEHAFTNLEVNTYFNAGAIEMDGEMIKTVGTIDRFPEAKYLQELTPRQEIEQFPATDCGKGSAVYFYVKGFEDFRIFLFRNAFNGQFSSNALSYIGNLFKEIYSIREPIQQEFSPKGASDGVVSIKQRLEYICYIQASSPFCKVFLENEKKPLELPVSMKEIELYLGDDPLCRVHRKYFVNPEKATAVRKKNQKDFELLYGTTAVPIGRTYLKKIRSKYTYLFSR